MNVYRTQIELPPLPTIAKGSDPHSNLYDPVNEEVYEDVSNIAATSSDIYEEVGQQTTNAQCPAYEPPAAAAWRQSEEDQEVNVQAAEETDQYYI